MARSTSTGNGQHLRHKSTPSGPTGRRSASPTKDKGRIKVQLEDFELIRVLGKGCAGRVLLVRHAKQNTVHAMKAVSKRSVLASDELGHIITELDILKRFAIYEPNNDFVTRLNYAFTDRENFYFVMDFYPGGDLATQLEIFGTLGHVRTRFYAADLVLGLEDLHRHGVILRDLKPENILLNASGHCVIADFGLSKEFEYRGDPQPLHVPLYQGEMVLPHWAGMGMGSIRTSPTGKKRIVVDRAWSFVGTTEYLAPEVIRGQEYSYAVDWWGLGCILFECLLGRAPFRQDDDEPPQALYNRILFDPWDQIFSDPNFRRRKGSEGGLDAVTEGFLDALLQKDPMRRLTEPCVREHFYFSQIDWENVRSGDYVDPHQLHLHPLAEYNTRYFPKLCLELDPNVDMSTHNREESDDTGLSAKDDPHRKLTPLNDENTFKFEQLKNKRELEGFYWSREDHEWVDGVDEADELGDVGGLEGTVDEESTLEAGLSSRGSSLSLSLVDPDSDEDEAHCVAELQSEGGDEHVEDVIESDGNELGIEGISIKESAGLPIPASTPTTIPPSAPPSEAMSTMQLSSPVASPERLITPVTSAGDLPDIPIHFEEPMDLSIPHSNLDTDPEPEKPSTPIIIPTPVPASLSPTVISIPVAPRPRTITHKSIPIPVLKPKPRPEMITRLPSGLPVSGLSSSDVVSIASPDIDGPRLIRRHPQLTSMDSVPTSRLSIDLNGTITQLGEDDWEALETESGRELPSAPNGYGSNLPPSSFFTRLRRRPSTVIASGLRRTTQPRSTDSSSRETSPTKTVLARPVIFGGTKKVMGKLKAFPLLRSRRNSELPQEPNADQTSSSSPTSSSRQKSPLRSSPTRPPGPPRRHTESGWFERRISKGLHQLSGDKSKGTERGGRSLTQSSDGSGSTSTASVGAAGKAGVSRNSGGPGWIGGSEGNRNLLFGKKGSGPPRVELNEMGSPVDWTFGAPVSGPHRAGRSALENQDEEGEARDPKI